ncbi:MAG: hypothetical protein ACRDJ9_33180, partial [Dehalococcoidia bacterium]
MANNFNITPGSGGIIATDDVSGVHYQLVKLVDATEDATSRILVPVAATDNLANPTAPQMIAHLMGFDGSAWDRVRSQIGGDGQANGLIGLLVLAYNHLFNGSNFDRQRGNSDVELLASAARTATTTSADQLNHNGRGVVLLLDVTANPGGAETLT